MELLTPNDDEVIALCQKLGIDPNIVNRIVIDIDVSKPIVTAHVYTIATKEAVQMIVRSDKTPKVDAHPSEWKVVE